jgi:hypothetical protein
MVSRRVKVTAFALMAILPFFILTCSSSVKTARIVDKEHGWLFPVPTVFNKSNEKLPVGFQRFSAPQENGYTTTIVISSLRGEQSAESVAKDIARDPGDGIAVQSSSPASFAGVDGYSIIATENKGTETHHQVVLTNHGVCVILTLTTLTADYDKWDSMFQDCLKGFKWITPTPTATPKPK